jgi:hypothetical protein
MIIALGALAGTLVLPAVPAYAFHDVPSGFWAGQAPAIVSVQHDWMRDYGTDWFHPNELVTRRSLARSMVKAFAPEMPVDPTKVFTDLPATDPDYQYANVAMQLGLIGGVYNNKFIPNGYVPKWDADRALTVALGLRDALVGLSNLKTANGYVFPKPRGFADMTLAMELQLHYNHPTTNGQDVKDLLPSTPLNRAEFAYSLARAKDLQDSWAIRGMRRYETITLPAMTDAQKRVVTFALQWVGYPYIYGGEWYKPTPGGYCCGSQPQGGFDCSGFDWWVAQRASAGFPVTTVRPYAGWSLPERTSYDMARATRERLRSDQLHPGDLLFFQSDRNRTDWPAIDHAGLALGNGWMIHSSGSRAGVTISWIGYNSWWGDHFRWGRRLF